MKIFIKVADVSNEARPMDVAEPWLECLLEESFNQVDSSFLLLLYLFLGILGDPVTSFLVANTAPQISKVNTWKIIY